jgi:hypothetical protein
MIEEGFMCVGEWEGQILLCGAFTCDVSASIWDIAIYRAGQKNQSQSYLSNISSSAQHDESACLGPESVSLIAKSVITSMQKVVIMLIDDRVSSNIECCSECTDARCANLDTAEACLVMEETGRLRFLG